MNLGPPTHTLGSVGDSDERSHGVFLGRMQTELLNIRKTWRTAVELVRAVDVWLNFYNGNRWHSYTGYMSPDQYKVLWNDFDTPPLFT